MRRRLPRPSGEEGGGAKGIISQSFVKELQSLHTAEATFVHVDTGLVNKVMRATYAPG